MKQQKDAIELIENVLLKIDQLNSYLSGRLDKMETRFDENDQQHRRTQERVDRLEIKVDHQYHELKDMNGKTNKRVTRLEARATSH